MATMPYRAVSWMPREVVTDDKMNVLANNMQWLHDYTPRAMITDAGVTRAEGIKIAAGKYRFLKKKSDTATGAVHFNDFFSTYCHPSITTGIVSDSQRKIFTVIYGMGQLLPDHRGFNIGVEVAAEKKKDKIARRFWVNWIAVGY